VHSYWLLPAYYWLHQKINRETSITVYNDQQMRNYFTKHHTATCFDTIVSSSGSL